MLQTLSKFRKFRHGISIVERCYQLSSRKVVAQSVINWTGIGQLNWQYLRAPTLDRCSLSQWWSSSVHSTISSRGSVTDSWYCPNRQPRRINSILPSVINEQVYQMPYFVHFVWKANKFIFLNKFGNKNTLSLVARVFCRTLNYWFVKSLLGFQNSWTV